MSTFIKRYNFHYFLVTLTLALFYFLAGKFSLFFLHGNNIVNIGIFASEGIALAFILYFGPRVWIGIFLGQLALALSNDVPLLASLGIAIINSLEALLAYLLVQKFKLNIKLETFRDIFGLVLLIIFILQPFSALLSNILLVLNDIVPQTNYLKSSFSWWFGNIMGQLLITPFLLLLFNNYKQINILNYIFYALFFALYIYILEVVLVITNLLLLLSLSIPIIVYVVSTKGFSYGTLFNVVVALISSYSVYLDIGAFHFYTESIENVINYNLFVLAHISTVFVTGILFEERRRYHYILEHTIKDAVDKNKEQQFLLLQQSRLAQMGEMIAMIAHQWRQPLNNLSLVNQLLTSKYHKGKLDDKTIEYFTKNSKKQIKQMSSTIDDFRNFFKSEKIKKEFSINEVINETLNITQDIYKNHQIDILFHSDSEYYNYGYPNQLGQALLNLINNAKDALNELEIEKKYIKITLSKEDEKVVISIEDNGGGIAEEIQEQIFDPYFSTKKNKNGTGLGLYMTKMIIQEQLNSEIHFSNSQEGAVFKIFLQEGTYES